MKLRKAEEMRIHGKLDRVAICERFKDGALERSAAFPSARLPLRHRLFSGVFPTHDLKRNGC